MERPQIKIDFSQRTELCEIMTKFGSDKGNHWHNYTFLYSELFGGVRDKKLNFFELGIGTNNPDLASNMGINGRPGASLRGWKEFFPNAEIFGADIDKDILFSEERISTFYCDQTNPQEIKKMWESIGKKMDIIVDDGLHSFDANITFLENSIAQLKEGGIYIIEDVLKEEEKKFLEYIKNRHDLYYTFYNLPSQVNPYDNSLFVIAI